MRNLKRVLSLTLASVMLLGMMVIGSSAAGVTKIDFTDANEIEYTEAVDVMVALGVLQGTGKGDFQPKATLTREAAAKIICYMLLGEGEAEKLTANKDVFLDVAANRWSAGYISYCVERGILAGTGDGRFLPTAELTGVAFGKMLLVALGYDPALQGYTGGSWALSVAADMVDAKIAPSGVMLSSPMTREQAAQAAFLTLKADVVRYQQKGTVVDMGNGNSVTINPSEPVAVGNDKSDDYRTKLTDQDDKQQFCEKYFPKLTMTTAPDDFGCPATQWKYKGAEIGKYADEADLVYISDVKVEDIYKDLGLSSAVAAKNVKFFIDGVEEDTNGIKANDNSTYLVNVGINRAANKNVEVGAKGSTTRVYHDSDAIDGSGNGTSVTVSVTNYYLAQATENYDTNDEEVTLNVKATGIGSLTVKNEDVAVSNVVKDEYYVVTLDKSDSNAVKSVVPAEAVANVTVSSARSDDYVTAGSKYEYNAIAKKAGSGALGQDMMADSSLFKFNDNEYTLYLDPNGYVLGMELTAGDANVGDYLVITKQAADSAYDVIVKVMFTDGTEKNITVAKIGSNENPVKTDLGSSEVGKFYTFTEKKNGEYELEAVTVGASAKQQQNFASGKTIENKTRPLGNTLPIATSKTVFIQDGKVYTGNRDIPEMTDTSKKVSYVTDKDNRLLIVWTEGKGKSTVDTDELVYILKSTPARNRDEDNNWYYTYDAIYQGKKTTIDVNDASTKATGLYEIDSWTDGYADLGKAITMTENYSYVCGKVTGNFDYVDGTLIIPGVGAGAFTLTDDVQVFTIDGDTVKTPGPDGLGSKTYTDGFTTAILVRDEDDANAKIAAVYLIKGASGGPVDVPSTGNQGQSIEDALNGTSNKVEINGDTTSGATIDKNLTVPSGKELTIGGKVTVNGDISGAGTVTVAADADVTVSSGKTLTVDSVAPGASIDASSGGKVTVADGGTIGAGAEITVKSLDKITIGEDVDVKEAVILEGADSGTDLATVGAGIPVYIAESNSYKVGSTENDISTDTIFLTYEGRKATNSEAGVGKVIFEVKNASGTTVHTEDFSPANTNKGNFYFSLSHPTDGSGHAVENPFTNGARYQVVISQVQSNGAEPTILASVWFTAKITPAD